MKQGGRRWTNRANVNVSATACNPFRGDLLIAPGCVLSFVLQRRGGDGASSMVMILVAGTPLQNKRGGKLGSAWYKQVTPGGVADDFPARNGRTTAGRFTSFFQFFNWDGMLFEDGSIK